MLKRIFLIFLCIFSLLPTISASAYEVTNFEITAKAGVLISLDTDEYIYSNNIDQKIYPAAITNIMTALVILESDKYSPDGRITMTEKALTDILGTGVAVTNTKAGEEFSHTDLLHFIMMCSCGDAGYLAADYFYGSHEAFVEKMNAKAKDLGLENTNFTNPIGLHDENHYTTVRDIATLSKYALQNKTFKEICAKHRYNMEATNMRDKRILSTTNFLLDTTTNYYYQYASGIKTGYTDEAGRCIVATASYNGYNYLCILMNSPNNPLKRSELKECADLFRWAFNNFKFKEIATSTEPVCEIPLKLSMDTDFVPLYFEKPFISVLPKDADDSTIVINTKLKVDSVKAPVRKGQVLGEAEVIFAEKVIGRVNLVVGEDVKGNALLKGVDFVKGIFTSVYMKVIYVVLGIAVLIFVGFCIKMNLSRLKKRKVKYVPYDKKIK
ncbi:MAG: D-alanyl-D-alanine carboxypeptidase [Clostridia bacterium]|nr:D-alanyl-D-alanine carboxypeptidase [Clostridia bacterium]